MVGYIDVKQQETYQKLKNRGCTATATTITVTTNKSNNNSNNYNSNVSNTNVIIIIIIIKIKIGKALKKLKVALHIVHNIYTSKYSSVIRCIVGLIHQCIYILQHIRFTLLIYRVGL